MNIVKRIPGLHLGDRRAERDLALVLGVLEAQEAGSSSKHPEHDCRLNRHHNNAHIEFKRYAYDKLSVGINN